MGMVEGQQFICDRAAGCHANGKRPEVFMNPTDKARDKWKQVTWTDTQGVDITYLLCPECREKYEDLDLEQRKSTQSFMYDHILGG